MKKSVILVIVLIIIMVALIFLSKNNKLEAPEVVNDNSISNTMPKGEENEDVEEMVVTGEVKEFTIEGKNFSFNPSTLTVNKGDKVKITFKVSEGFHDFKIDEYGVATKQSKAPAEEVLEFTANKTGSFEYYCSVGSHRQMGMKGTLIVK